MRSTPLYQVDEWESEKARDKKLSPERELMRAVLEDAINVLQATHSNMKYWDFTVAETKRWLKSTDDEWLFSFVNVCSELGLDPSAVRKHYERWLK